MYSSYHGIAKRAAYCSFLNLKSLKTALAFGLILLLICPFQQSLAQGSDDYGSGLKVELSEDGSKYFRLLTWHQFWLTVDNKEGSNLEWTPSLRRSRVLMYARINERFLILTHFGFNNLSPASLHPVGQSDKAQLFMHDAWAEYTIVPEKLALGGGLHYWNGISRMTSASTLNLLTLDAPRFNWPSLGTSDQFARHMGIYAKGSLNRLDYRLSMSKPAAQTLDDLAGYVPALDTVAYTANSHTVYQGYLSWSFLDTESGLLPYKTGTYLGSKKILNIGGGFLHHPGATARLDDDENLIFHDVNLFALDVFADLPLKSNGSAVTAYLAYYNFDFGPEYILKGTDPDVGSGDILYAQAGYLLPDFSKKIKLQPYAAWSYRMYEANDHESQRLNVGVNLFVDGHHAKITPEFQLDMPHTGPAKGLVRLQAMVYL